jgi:hypothetical protein
MPRVVQVEDVALILYDPKLPSRLLFSAFTHAFFPRAAFDEVVQGGGWTFGRKGRGYVALWSAAPTQWQTTGTFADRELIAPGARNAWICQVGNEREDGTFADFRARITAARVSSVGQGNDLPGTPLSVSYDAPGVGPLELAFEGAPTRNGQAFSEGGFERYDSPYSQTPWGARKIAIAHAGAKLDLDLDKGTRTGDGLP